MRKNIFKAILFFSLFLVLFSFRGYAAPILSSNVSSIPHNYNTSFVSEFNVTWTNSTENENVTSCNFTLGRPDGTIMTYDSIALNSTTPPSLCSINFTQDELGSAGDYNYSWSAKNDTDDWTTTNIWEFTINPADNPVHLYFNNGTEYLNQNVTITYGTLINVTGLASGGNVSIYRDGEDVTAENGQEILLGNGTYAYKVNATGNQNYSDNSTELTHYVFVNKANPTVTLLIDSESNNVTVDKNWTVNFTAYSDIPYVDITLNTNLSGWVDQSNTTIVYNLTKLLDEGIYNITAYINENENYSANSTTYYLNVSEIAPQYSNVNINPPMNSQYDPNKIYQFNITWKDGSLDNVTFNIYNTTKLDANSINITFNSILNSTDLVNYTVDENTKIFSASISGLPKGNYNYNWTAFDTFNKSSSIFSTYIVNPKDITANITLLTDPTSLPSGGGYVTASCSFLNIYQTKLTITFVGVSDGSKTGNVGESVTLIKTITSTNDITCSVTGNANYTGHKLGSVTVASPTPSGPSGGDTGDGLPTGSFLIKDLISSLSVVAGESKSTTFKLSNTLSSNMKNVNISLTGISSTWYRLSRTSISLLKRNVPESVTITFTIPEDAEAKNYSVTITAKGKPLVGSTRTTTKTMKLKVTAPIPKATSQIEEPEEEIQEAIIGTTQENITANATVLTPTGLAAAFEYLKNNLVIVVTIAACLLIFMFRNNITTTLMKAGGKKVPKKVKKMKLPSLSKYKLAIRLKGVRGRKKEALEKEPEMRRPEVLEREIKRDIKELQQVLEADKKIKKKKKKFDLENN